MDYEYSNLSFSMSLDFQLVKNLLIISSCGKKISDFLIKFEFKANNVADFHQKIKVW